MEIEAESEAPGVPKLALLRQGVEAGALDVAEEPFQPEPTGERASPRRPPSLSPPCESPRGPRWAAFGLLDAMRRGLVTVEGPPDLVRAFPGWLGLSAFASVRRPAPPPPAGPSVVPA